MEDGLVFDDPVITQVMQTVPLPVIESTKNVFHDLVSCIIEQQIHYRSSKQQFQKLLDQAAIERLTPDNFSHFETQSLQNIKLSGRKLETLSYTVDFFSSKQIDWPGLTDNEVREVLSGIKGIGPWTIDMILLFTLDRPDIFPADDYHLKMIMSNLYHMKDGAGMKKRMNEAAEAWKPLRSTAVRYLLAWKEWQSVTAR